MFPALLSQTADFYHEIFRSIFLETIPMAAAFVVMTAPLIFRLVLIEVLAPILFAVKRNAGLFLRQGSCPFLRPEDPLAPVALLGSMGHFG